VKGDLVTIEYTGVEDVYGHIGDDTGVIILKGHIDLGLVKVTKRRKALPLPPHPPTDSVFTFNWNSGSLGAARVYTKNAIYIAGNASSEPHEWQALLDRIQHDTIQVRND
jgi:hypothetical protein